METHTDGLPELTDHEILIRQKVKEAAARKELKDSGERQEFDSGAVRDTSGGKGRYDLLQMHAIFRLANTLEKGAKKYDSRNWEKGMPLSRFADSGMRHLAQYIAGYDDEDHLAQALWNIASLIETEYRIHEGVLPEELDDLPKTMKGKVPPYYEEG